MKVLLTFLISFISFNSFSQISTIKEILRVHNSNIVETEDFLLGKGYRMKDVRNKEYGKEYSFYFGTYPIGGNAIKRILNGKNEVIYTEYCIKYEKDYLAFKKQLTDNSFEYLNTYEFDRGIKHLYTKDNIVLDIYIAKDIFDDFYYDVRFVDKKFALTVYGNDVLKKNNRKPVTN
ncbi:hypothetical protein [Sphingobacterium sp. IITKGP-BTPF85]|uniref:hypothetical protein n=1 Tax=Sphingobacterium sp. IITKGP-BTPF85 TaxID=1338009 RepID=UPI000389FF52|nr:hypothetical protein [Sphingobacterium sp. IITKGP-BTPF85]KKX49179.1 hypothetical protein L950_0216950 [Sphingobacterium sp. IITKGP-BTPF85]